MDVVRESRAGDDFHLLWAARRALALLDPRSELTLVRLEGLNPADVDDGDDRFLGVDLTEYYGGPTIPTATRVVATQLKYSVRHPARKWTGARLAAPTRSGGTPVIRRLADIFSGLVEQAGGDVESVVQRAQIRLMSNQPAAQAIVDVLTRAQAILREVPVGVQARHVTRLLPSDQRDVIARLQAPSGLSSALFAGFLRVLDVSGCGAEPRAMQRIRISEQMGRLIVGPHTHGLPALLELVRHQVLPEASQSPGLGRADVLAALGASSEDDLLPAPSRFGTVARRIPTPDPVALASVVVDAPGGKAIAHGPAGIGKTTTVLGLGAHLPDGSAVVAYDSFGGGDYLSPGEERHTPRRALVQIANDVSLQLGTEPLLLSAVATESDLWRRFRQRLDEAAAALSHGAILLIVIDAADNATYAASRRNERSFVEDMWELQLPANVRLLMTCRTHRLNEISPPDGIDQYLLAGFDIEASTCMLRTRFVDATPADGRLFHERTHGVPRVQAYLLAANESDSLVELLRRSEKGLTEVFEDVLRAALDERTDRSTAQRDIATLFAMARPVLLHTLAGALGVTPSAARRIGASLEPGVTVIGDSLQFPDEDFEHFLRDRLSAEDLRDAHGRLADHFLPLHRSDGEAAIRIAEHLRASGRDEELIELALQDPLPEAVQDGLARALVGRRRLSLAIEASTREASPEQSLKLLLLAAQVARSDTSLTSVIRARPDLVARFADSEAIGTIYMREESDPWLGPAHFRVAAVLAWDPATAAAAREQLMQAQAWVRRWSSLEGRVRRTWDLTAHDIGRGAAALWGLDGADRAAEFLSRWRPPEVVADAVTVVAELVARHLDASVVARHLRRLQVPTWVQAQFIVALSCAGKPVPRAWIERVARRLANIGAEHPVFGASKRPEWGLEFCELAARNRLPKRVVSGLIGRLGTPLSAHVPSEYDPLTDWGAPLRSACLLAALGGRELSVDDLLPEELRPEPSPRPGQYDPNEGKRRTFREALRPFLPIYMARAQGLVETKGVAEVGAIIDDSLAYFREQAASRWFRTRHRYRTWATTAVDAAAAADGDATQMLNDIAHAAGLVLPRSASLHVQMAASLARWNVYSDVALGLIDEAAQELMTKPYAASERRDVFLDAAAVAAELDAQLGAELFGRAVDAAQGIDDDVGLHLAVLARLAGAAASAVPPGSARPLAERFARSMEAVAPYVSDPSEVLPYAQVMATIAQLDPPSAFALSSRWDDEDRVSMGETIPVVVRSVCKRGWVAPEIGLRLLRLAVSDYQRVRTGIALLDLIDAKGPNSREELVRTFTTISEWVRRDVQIDERVRLAGDLITWAMAHSLGENASAQELSALLHLASSVEGGQESISRSTARQDRSARQHHSTTDSADLLGTTQRMLENYVSEHDLHEYLSGVVAAASAHRRLDALGRVARLADELPDRRTVIGAVARTLRDAMSRWAGSSRIQAWGSESLAGFVESHLPKLFSVGTTRYGGWTTTLDVPFDLTAERLPDLLRACAARLNELDAAQLFAIAEACGRLTPTEVMPVLIEWALQHVAPLRLADSPELPEDPTTTVGLLLWSALGHPDDRIRWRAAHCARELLVHERLDGLADVLVSQLDTTSVAPWRADDLDFYWLSARMWALLVIARVSGDAPDLLVRHATRLAAIATDRALPHAAAREFAKRAALRVAGHSPGLLSDDVLEALTFSNCPLASHAARGHHYEGTSGPSMGRDITRFHFDSMDTTRYWYEPLARVFGLPTDEITRRADRWVTDVWGRTNEECYRDDRRYRHEHDWYLRSNDHGSRPLIEVLRVYLEYHAMLMVAGELIDAGTPVLFEPYEDASDPWQGWLRQHLDTDPSCWLADRRSPTPLDPICYGSVPTRATFEVGGESAFDALIGLDAPRPRRVVVSGWLSTSDYDHYVTVHVSSALVEPSTSTALLRALQTAPPREFPLPYAGEGDEFDRSEITEPGFELSGWLDDLEVHWEGLDDHDPFAVKHADDRTVPSGDFQAFHHVRADPTGCRFVGDDGGVIVLLEVWGDGTRPGDRHEVTRASEGERTWVAAEALLSYLAHRERDLIMKAGVHMFAKSDAGRRSTEEEEEHGYDESRIYLLRQDGTVETVEGQRRPWNADRQ